MNKNNILPDISATLEIFLDKEPIEIGDGLMNLKALPSSKIKSLSLNVRGVYTDDFQLENITDDVLNTTVYDKPELSLKGLAGIVVEHVSPNNKCFTVQDVLNAVEETERQTRDKTEWFGGVDVHHVFFEGIGLDEDDIGNIWWGS